MPIFAATAGRRESGAPEYTFGGRIQGQLGPVEIGLQAKRTGPRFVNDVNQPIVLCSAAFVNVNNCPASATPINAYGARAPAFTLVDLDVRVPLGFAGFNDETYFQFNVTNIVRRILCRQFRRRPAGNDTAPFVQLGAPRAYIATLVVGFR